MNTQTGTISRSVIRIAAVSSVLIASLFDGIAGAEIISSDRRITWTPGVSGGIPNRTNVCAALSPSGGDDGAAIATAIKNCPAEGVVKLNAGTFMLSSGFNVNKNITVRGAGPSSTILNVTGPGNQKVSMGGGGFGAPIPVNRGYTRGSTSITVASASNIVAGDLLWLDQNNDNSTTVVTQRGTGGSCKWCGGLDIGSPRGGVRALGQIIKVTAVSGNTLTLEKGLYWNYVSAAKPAVWKMTTVSRAGIEDLQVTQGNSYPARNLIFMSYCNECWVKNAELKNGKQRHLEVTFSYRFEVRDSFFHLADRYGQDHGYCMSFWDGATDGLVENNIMDTCLLAVAFNGPCAGNVIAYNYSNNVTYTADPTFLEGDFATHGAHPYFNLFEGNMGYMAQHDVYWGSSSHNTWFRNRFSGYKAGLSANLHSVIAEANQTYLNYVGNILGTAAPAYKRYETENLSDPGCYNQRDVYKIGYDAGSGDCSASGNDPNAKLTMLRHGNYDYFNRAVVWDAAIADRTIPTSLYLSAKPSWWGSQPWPPIGPDVSGFVQSIPAKDRFDSMKPPAAHTVTPSAGPNGSISPDTARTVTDGTTAQFMVTPNAGYTVAVGGTCGGTLSGATYTTNAVTADCTVVATFTLTP